MNKNNNLMNKHQVLELLDTYENKFKEMSIEPLEANFNGFITGNQEELTLGHCYGMIPQMRNMIDGDEGLRDILKSRSSWEKVNRWLGFVQGVMWCEGVYTINQMRGHNRSK